MMTSRVAMLGGLALALSLWQGSAVMVAADGGGADEATVEDVALRYARSFGDLVSRDPDEAVRLNVTTETLAHGTPAGTYPVLMLDSAFAAAGESSGVDEWLVVSSLWWVVLSATDGSAIVVAVDWPQGHEPQPAGLNWVPASELTAAIANFDPGSTRVVWPTADVPFVIGTARGQEYATAIVSATMAKELGISLGLQALPDYGRELRARIRARPNFDRGPDLPAGFGYAGGADAAPSHRDGGQPVLIGASLLVAVLIMMLIGMSSLRIRRRRRFGY